MAIVIPLRGALAPVKALAERLVAADMRVSHARNGVFKAGNTAGFSRNQITLVWFRKNAVATREGFGAFGQWNWRLGVRAITR
jgi:hypothetical protein